MLAALSCEKLLDRLPVVGGSTVGACPTAPTSDCPGSVVAVVDAVGLAEPAVGATGSSEARDISLEVDACPGPGGGASLLAAASLSSTILASLAVSWPSTRAAMASAS